MLILLIFLTLIFGCYSEEDAPLFDLTNFRGIPSAIVGGHVNVITGDFIDYEMDSIFPGSLQFPLERVYTSSNEEQNIFGTAWRINFNYSATWAIDSNLFYSPECPVKGEHYFTVSDGLGG